MPCTGAVYALGRPDLPVEGRWLAAALACGVDAVLSHRSAAALHGLLRNFRSTVAVTVPRRFGCSRAGIQLHRVTRLDPQDRACFQGIPCISMARTLLDLAAVVHPGSLERACDQAEVLGVLDMRAVRDAIMRAPRRPGVRMLRQDLGVGIGEDIPRSELEDRFLTLCGHAMLALPKVNQWITVASEPTQVDFLWRETRVIAETDGYRTHRTRQAFRRDRRAIGC